jgi:imidazolonepropionase
MNCLIYNIKGLVQVREAVTGRIAGKDMKVLPILGNAYLLIQDGLIRDYGAMESIPDLPEVINKIDATGRYVFPAFADSHSHIVYAGSREGEFVDRINGLTYEEIARKGGGILNSAKRLQHASEDELFESALARLHEISSFGTGAVEIKSGYGLTLEDELKMLRVIRRLKEASRLTIRATFLGAHAIPKEYSNRKEYVDLIVEKMIPQVAEEGLADYCDVFCDRGFFTVEETDRILEQGLKYGLKPKIHANELDYSGGIQIGVKHGAISVDHLECTGEEEIEALLNSDTMPTLLPGTAFFLKLAHYPPARQMIDAGLPVALATDYNPGSCPSGNMPFVLSLACTQMQMTPEEAINAATINAACAMELEGRMGSITKGKEGSVFITRPMNSVAFLPYAFGSRLIDRVIIKGEEVC